MKRDEAKVRGRARAIAETGSLAAAVAAGRVPQFDDITASEALVLGLLNQGVRKYVGVFGHGSTDIARVLSLYEERSLVRMWNVRNEVAAAHAATMLRWQYGETAAVITSIGPGALQAFAGSLVDASNGVGVYHIYGDETTHDEGPNMQQVPRDEQGSFLTLASTMGRAYQLSVPEAIFAGLRWGAAAVFHPTAPGPFFFLVPMNVQPAIIRGCNLLEFPERPRFAPVAAEGEVFARATELARGASAVAIKIGGGARHCGAEIRELARLLDAVIVAGAGTRGSSPLRRSVRLGGREQGVALRQLGDERCGSRRRGRRAGGLPVGLLGHRLPEGRTHRQLQRRSFARQPLQPQRPHRGRRAAQSTEVDRVPEARGVRPADGRRGQGCLGRGRLGRGSIDGRRPDGGSLGREPLCVARRQPGQPQEMGRVPAGALRPPRAPRRGLGPGRAHAARRDQNRLRRRRLARGCALLRRGRRAGQRLPDRRGPEPGHTFSDTGSSYMGFAVSSLLAGALADRPRYAFAITGDGSFTMNPQILIDGVEHGVRGCIVLLDNRRMAAISGLQAAQYGAEYRTSDRVEVDYVALARSVRGVKGIFGGHDPASLRKALEEAHGYDGLSLVHVPVYAGSHEMGGLGAYGAWNVGSWCEETQALHHRIGL